MAGPCAGLVRRPDSARRCCDVIDVHTGDTTGESETIAHGMYIFRNKDDEVSGFCIIGAVGAFRAGISKTVIISQH